MVDFQTYQKTTFLINNNKKKAEQSSRCRPVWVKGHFILLAPNHSPTYQVHWTISAVSSGERKSIIKINNKERTG